MKKSFLSFRISRPALFAARSSLLCLLSAVLLILSHPPHNFWFLAWIGLVPLFLVLEGKSAVKGFGWGYLTGLFYFFGMFWWFIHVTLPGMVLLNMFLALYFALFSATYALIRKKPVIVRILLAGCAWVAWEFVRSGFLSGFGWAALGHTQYQQLWFLKLSAWTGVYGVSFVLAGANHLVYSVARDWKNKTFLKKVSGCFFIGAVALLAVLVSRTEPAEHPGDESIKIAVVQPGIRQKDKWDPKKSGQIMSILEILTRDAVEKEPDLIVWPEASLPSIPENADRYLEKVQALAESIHTPILLGYVRLGIDGYFNTAVLINSFGDIEGWYDKLHLVPFGEFVPLRNVFPFLSDIVPIGDISSGEKPAVFYFPDNVHPPFSVLICFEDTVDLVPKLMAESGAKILINITNDAWFGDTKAPWLHLEAAVFQAASYGRPLVRAANTGVSAFVSSSGRIEGILSNEKGKATFNKGVLMLEAFAGEGKTFRLIFGDFFAYLCIACLIGNVMMIILIQKFLKHTGGKPA
ncbi:MAG: apolipoprotein N-acyltransferase [Candidatus Omnitrophota bacterium]